MSVPPLDARRWLPRYEFQVNALLKTTSASVIELSDVRYEVSVIASTPLPNGWPYTVSPQLTVLTRLPLDTADAPRVACNETPLRNGFHAARALSATESQSLAPSSSGVE